MIIPRLSVTLLNPNSLGEKYDSVGNTALPLGGDRASRVRAG